MVYNPRPVPQLKGDAGDLALWVAEELRNVSRAFQESEQVQHTVLHEEPPKPREGMVVVADGTDWNPGQGAGQYTYISGSWVYNGNIPEPPPDLGPFMQKSQNLNDVANKATSRANLGVAIGTDVQAYDPQLSSLLPRIDITSPTAFTKAHVARCLILAGAATTNSCYVATYTEASMGANAPPVGATITVSNWSGAAQSIQVEAGATLFWIPTLASGPRTLAHGSLCTVYYLGGNAWFVTGSGIT